jgi:hypothetical protein
MENSLPGTPESSRGVEAAELVAGTVLAGVLEALHPALGVLGVSFFELRRSTLLPRWLDTVNRRVSQSSLALDPSDPETVAMFTLLTRAALQTARQEKLELLAAAFVSAEQASTPDFLVEHFADLVVRFTPEHVRVLQITESPDAHGLNAAQLTHSEVLEAASGGAEQEVDDLGMIIDVVWNDLSVNGLVDSRYSVVLTNALGSSKDDDQAEVAIAEKGRRFLAYIGASAGTL